MQHYYGSVCLSIINKLLKHPSRCFYQEPFALLPATIGECRKLKKKSHCQNITCMFRCHSFSLLYLFNQQEPLSNLFGNTCQLSPLYSSAHFLESLKHTVILWHMMLWGLTFRLSANQIQPDIKLFDIQRSPVMSYVTDPLNDIIIHFETFADAPVAQMVNGLCFMSQVSLH